MRRTITTFILVLLAICGFAQDKAKTSIELFNSSWRNEQTGDWQLSLFDDCAIYDSKVWKYEIKSEKQVVLANEQQKVKISIGKDKAGKRDFTIDGTKMLLSKITTEDLPDYPTADSTAFSTEIKPGEATIIGYLKDIPEEFSFGKIYLKVRVADYIGAYKNEYSVVVDKDGMFKITVPLFGVNMAYLSAENGNQTAMWAPMVLDGGHTYFLLCDFGANQLFFMGEDARLQNELQGKWNVIDYGFGQPETRNTAQMISYFKENLKWYDDVNAKLKQTIEAHPTISKRYRDFMRVANRYAICNRNMDIYPGSTTGKLPEMIDEWISKDGYLDPTMPLTLTEKLGTFQTMRMYYEESKIRRRYYLTSEDLLARVQDGRLKMSNEDIGILKLWVARSKELKACDEMEDKVERRAMRETIDGKYPINDLVKFWKRPDIDSITNNDAPSRYKMEKMALDSLYKDKKLYDFALSLWLMRNMRVAEEGLPKELFKYIPEVGDSVLVNKIYERHYRLASAAKQEFPEVEASVRSSSDVEGLTDGKAILEKILEPFKGKFVHIDFWGTWCGGCMQQMQATPMLKSELKDYDMVYLYFANKSKDNVWKRNINDLNVYGQNSVHYNLPKAQEDALEDYLKIMVFPSYFLVDKQGNVHNMGNAVMADIPAYKKKIEELNAR